jgi:hypothetical protein
VLYLEAEARSSLPGPHLSNIGLCACNAALGRKPEVGKRALVVPTDELPDHLLSLGWNTVAMSALV